jgi:hypothetical protein
MQIALAVIALSLLPTMAARHLVMRRIRAGDRRHAWLVFGPAFVYATLGVWTGLSAAQVAPPIGSLIVVGAVTYLVVVSRSVVGFARSSPKAVTDEEFEASVSEVTAQLMLVGMALVLLGALLFIVGLVGWAILDRLGNPTTSWRPR